MKAIRGATTVKKDNPVLITAAVKELLLKIKDENNIQKEDIVSIIFSSTKDLRSAYPAKAAREAGFEGCPLFSAEEPDIEGALPLCIRVMLFVNKDFSPVHIYLNEAKKLRKDISSIINIALDGPAGSGKSTVAKLLAKDYNILYLDTGAMYRACALKVLRSGADASDENAVKSIIDKLTVTVKYISGAQHTYLDGEDVSSLIRTPEVSSASSKVSSYGFVREKMVAMQRDVAKSGSCVIDGRDIGSCVIPDTPFKFFVTASSKVRAGRRAAELKEKGFDVNVDDVEKDIIERDYNDMHRKISPLVQADDAVVVDTSDMTIDEVVSFIKQKIQEKI